MCYIYFEGETMKKLLLIVCVFLFCIVGVNAKKVKNLKLSKVKYETYDAMGNKQKGSLNFTTTYIYDVEDL